MKNCLFTKYNAEINNSNLPILGTIVINHVATSTTLCRLTVKNGETITLTADGDGYFASSASYLEDESKRTKNLTLTGTGSEQQFHATGNKNYTITISPKYNIVVIGKRDSVGFTDAQFNITRDFNGCKDITMLHLSYAKGSTLDIANYFDDLSVLRILDGEMSGDIANLGKFTSLTALYLPAGVYGSLEAFVIAQVANGRSTANTSNAISIFALLTNITFGGSTRNMSTQNHVTWKSATKIAVYYGNVDINSCTKVMVKGYTDGEIEEDFSGFDVTKVD